VILGAGLIGCEFANDLAGAGHSVTLVDPDERTLNRLITEGDSVRLQTALQELGAERRTIDRFAAALFESRIGEVVTGIVVAVTSFGAFVRIDDGAADGLMPMHALPDDFYDFNESTQTLAGRHNGWVFAPGNDVKVKIREVTAISGGILLDWVDGGIIDQRPRKKPQRSGTGRSALAARKKTSKARKAKTKRR